MSDFILISSEVRAYVLKHPDCSMAELALAFDITLNAAKMHTRQLTKKGAIKRVGREWGAGEGERVISAWEGPKQRMVSEWEPVAVRAQTWCSGLGL